MAEHPCIVVMGVSGSGKSTLALALSQALSMRYVDADDHHPPQNVAKMARGEALTDEDRRGWLLALAALLDQAEQSRQPVVLACSALKASYRQTLAIDKSRRPVVYIEITPELAAERVSQRREHFMPASLIESQFQALQPPTDAVRVAATWPVEQSVAYVMGKLPVLGLEQGSLTGDAKAVGPR